MTIVAPKSGEMVEPAPRQSFSPLERSGVAALQEYRCAKCAADLHAEPWQIDHILPIELLGKHEWANWQALCVPCHKEKSKIDIKRIRKGARLRKKMRSL